MPDTETDVVWICAHVEAMSETTEYTPIPRAEWDAMTPEQRDDTIRSIADDAVSNAGGYGVMVVDEDEVPESWRRQAEA
jgi:hypothetical protein